MVLKAWRHFTAPPSGFPSGLGGNWGNRSQRGCTDRALAVFTLYFVV